MDVAAVWRIRGRGGPIVSGPIHSGSCSVGDLVELQDALGTTTATVMGMEVHVRRGEPGLLLGDVQGELRQGQVVRVR